MKDNVIFTVYLLFLASGIAFCDDLKIHNESRFIEFMNEVNQGINFEGITVFLDSDIDLTEQLSQQFGPIGSSSNSYFKGTFDGQGHTISNLFISSSLAYVGLFGYSDGSTIKNIVLDKSCSITSSYVPTSYDYKGYVGGIMGYCQVSQREFRIENSVNMANVTFDGSISSDALYLYAGGIIGYPLPFNDQRLSIINCVNYGSITHSGTNSDSYIGGIAGYSDKYYDSTIITKIHNCLNYGTINHIGVTSNSLYIGGIVGYSVYANIENCVSAGSITTNSSKYNIGSITGHASSTTYIMHSFWTSNVGYNANEESESRINKRAVRTDSEMSQVELNLETVNKLNEYSADNSWNKWLLNTNNKTVTFIINDYEGFSFDSQLILLPDLVVDDEHIFSRWYNDENLISPFDSNEVYSDKTLYGMLCESLNYTVEFDVNGGDELGKEKADITCKNTYGRLPTPTRTEATFNGWFTKNDGGEKIETGKEIINFKNYTIYAQWTINQYKITFNFNNGTDSVKLFDFNSSVVYPDISAEGNNSFYGWDINITNMPAKNLTITAQWAFRVITITFNKKELGSGNVIEIINKYSDQNIIIAPIQDDDDTVIYIIKFIDQNETAVTNFIDNIKDDPTLSPAINNIKVDGVDWKESDDNTTLIIVVVVVVFVVILAVLLGLLGFFIIQMNAHEHNNPKRGLVMRIAPRNIEVVDASTFESRFKEGDKIYPDDYAIPKGIKEALMNMGIDEDSAREAQEICELSADVSNEKGHVMGVFTLNDAAAVCLYTFDFGGDRYEMNPFRLLNKGLSAQENKLEAIVNVRDVLYLILSALRKLPVVKGITLHRGIRVKLDVNQYQVGSTIVWPGFSSTSPDMNVTKEFLTSTFSDDTPDEMPSDANYAELTDDGKEKKEGTLFIIEDGWGYDIQPYSRYPEEEEVLLEPEREFEVTSVTDTDNILIINLKMKNTKVILPEVFGDCQK